MLPALTTPVTRLVVRDTADHLAALRTSLPDLQAAGFVHSLELVEDTSFGVTVTLAEA